MPRGYVKIKGRKKEAILLIQGRLIKVDLMKKSLDHWHEKLRDQLDKDRVPSGLYRISLSSFQGGRPSVKFNPKKMDPKKFADQIEKKDRKGHATTGSPGISGYQRATDASSSAAHNRSREAVELVKWLKEDYNEPPEVKKRLGGRYGGEPAKAIANPGNKEPAMSARNEAVANAKDDVTPDESHEIEADLAEQPELNFVTHSQKMFEEMDDILGEAGPVGEVQKKLLKKLHGAGVGDHQLSDLARDPEFRRVHFGMIQRAASALKKKNLISYDGVSKVSLLEKGVTESILVTEMDTEITSYKGWPIYTLPNYITPYFYPQQRYIKGKKVGGSMEHYPRIKKVETLIDKWLKQMGLKALNEFEARPSGAKGIGSRASSSTMAAANRKINPIPVPEDNVKEGGPPDMKRPRGNDDYIIRIIKTSGNPEKALRFFDRQSGLGGRKGIVARHAAARMRRYPKDFATAMHKEEFGDFRGSEVNGAVNDEPLKIKDMHNLD